MRTKIQVRFTKMRFPLQQKFPPSHSAVQVAYDEGYHYCFDSPGPDRLTCYGDRDPCFQTTIYVVMNGFLFYYLDTHVHLVKEAPSLLQFTKELMACLVRRCSPPRRDGIICGDLSGCRRFLHLLVS